MYFLNERARKILLPYSSTKLNKLNIRNAFCCCYFCCFFFFLCSQFISFSAVVCAIEYWVHISKVTENESDFERFVVALGNVSIVRLSWGFFCFISSQVMHREKENLNFVGFSDEINLDLYYNCGCMTRFLLLWI